MSITTLSPLSAPRRYPVGHIDSLGRLFVYDTIWSTATHNYTSTARAERFDPSTGAWTLLPFSLGCEQNVAHAMDSSNRFYKAGGQLVGPSFPGNPYSSACEYYDPVGNAWSSFASLPIALLNTFNWIDATGILWLLCGTTTASDVTNARKYSGGTSGTWTTLSAAPGGGGAVNGGVLDSAGIAYITVTSGFKRYNPATDTWASLATLPTGTSAYNLAIKPSAGQIYSVGSGLRRYDIASDTWSAALAAPPATSSQSYFGYHAPTNALYLIGNFPSYPIYKYDIATNVWTSTGDALSVGRQTAINRNVVQDGVGFYIFGGQGTNAFADSVTTVEYFVPQASAVATRSWVAVIG